jgi:tRNA1Val (adenine37-N6)-methyltransferase
MPNSYFEFKQFRISQEKASFKVGTDGVLLGACAGIEGVRSILDIGTGTGLIAIMLAQRSDAMIHAIEPDPASFHQCLENVSSCPWKERISVECISLQELATNDKFDLIVSNPPYFTDSLRNPDPRKSAARHSDHLNTEELLEHVEKLMSDDGRFQVIMPWAEGNLLVARAVDYGLYCNEILKIKPMTTSPVRRVILTFSRQKLKLSESFLTIEHGRRHKFTQEYIDLTSEFYLKF